MRSKHAGQDIAAIGRRRTRARAPVCMPDRQPSFKNRHRWTDAARFNGAGSPTRIRGGLVTVPQDYLDRPVAVGGAGTLGRRVALMFTSRGGLVRIIARRAAQGVEAVDFVEQQIRALS